MSWNDTSIALLTKLAGEGYSSSQMAAELGVTRNAVIGKLLRLGVDLTSPGSLVAKGIKAPTVPKKPRKPRKPRPKTAKHVVARSRLQALQILATQPAPEPEKASANGVSIMELTPHNCHWPINDVQSSDFHFCGARALTPLPYCKFHGRLAYLAPKARQPAKFPTVAKAA